MHGWNAFPTGHDHSDLYQQITVTAGKQHADNKALCLCRYLHLNCKLNFKPSSVTLLTFCLCNLILTRQTISCPGYFSWLN